jgi:hypothetical protein
MQGQNLLTRARQRALALVATAVAVAATTTVVGVTPPAGAASDNTLRVVAGEYVYQLKGSPKPGWVTIDFQNKGVEMHMMALAALKQGTTVAQIKQALSSEDDSAFGAIVDSSIGNEGQIDGLPTLISPKQATTATVQLPAGHYGILCFVPAPDGTPHALHGMIKTFDVKGAKSSAKPASTQATVDLTDTAINFPVDNPGRNLSLKITNSGKAPHSFALVKVNSGATLDSVKQYYDAFFSGQAPAGDPPGEIVGGVDTISPGGTGYLQQTLTRGHYGYVSTEGDDPSSDDYTQGLKGEFDVS